MEDYLSFLAVDDDPTQIELLRLYCDNLEYPRIRFHAARSAEEAFNILEQEQLDLVLTDYQLPDGNGMGVLERIKAFNPEIRVVVMTAFQDTAAAVKILKGGADDYLIKPTKEKDIERLLILVHERLTLHRETASVREMIFETFPDMPVVSTGNKMMEVIHTAAVCAKSDATVLITGESGTGKELVAKMIHSKSRRGDKAFVTVNISALSESLAESELFGHRKGAFTGAHEDRIGRFEEANGGTIFIDEVGDISQSLQVKLLRVLQFGEIQRVGENATKKLDVRIIAATNRDMKTLVRQGRYRSDLYYRINVIPIFIPPLRERKEDIPALIDHFIRRFSAENGKVVTGVSREVLDRIMWRPLPGNVRELENLIEHGVVFARTETIALRDIPELENPDDGPPEGCLEDSPQGGYEEKMRAFEMKILATALDESSGNQSRAAESLGITERHLRSRLSILGMKKGDRE
jgi:DNA-binding NtrC family response regulator